MECFIIENGVEHKAGLEDLIPIIGTHRWTLQHVIKEAVSSRIDLATALAFLPDEIKDIVYRNVSSRTGYMLKKQVGDAETGYSDYFVAKAKA
jgi:flagellar motor switch protein FliG